MRVTIEFPDGLQATVTDGVWDSEDKEMAQMLNDLTPVSAKRLGYWPHPNWMLVEPIVKDMKAKVISADELEYDPDMIY